jgi:hypothetical protein
MDGEIAYGPKVDRHWVTTGFMWPRDKMPDPMAAKRLTELGCKVRYQKTHLIEVRKIRKPDDIRPGTKKGHLDHTPIWVVEITMPKKLVFDIYKGYMDKMKNENRATSSEPNAAPVVAAPIPAPASPAMPAAPGAMPAAPGAAPAAPGGAV